MRSFFTSLVLALLAAAAAVPAASQELATDSPHERLYALLAAPEVQQRAMDAMIGEARRQFLVDEDISDLENECPGAVDRMVGVLRQFVAEEQKRNASKEHARFVGVLSREMPAEEAAAAASFFASEVGQRFLGSIAGQLNFEQSLASAIADDSGKVAREAFDKDREIAAQKAVGELSPGDLMAANLIMTSSDWAKTLNRIGPQLREAQFADINAEDTPEEDAAMNAAFTDVLTKHLAECEAKAANK